MEEAQSSIYKKFFKTWFNFLSFAIGAVGLWLTFYPAKPDIQFEVSAADIIDIHKPIKELLISFQGENIRERNLNLRLLTVRIVNNGRVDIVPASYDPALPWGVSISTGRIIEARVISSNSEYLKERLTPIAYQQNAVELPKAIFESGKYVVIEVLVLHEKNLRPEIIPLGKIAGIDHLNVINSRNEKTSNRFISQVFSGRWNVQLIRMTVYSLASLMVLLIFIFTDDWVSKLRKKRLYRKRQEKISATLFAQGIPDNLVSKTVIEMYGKYGCRFLEHLKEFMESDPAGIARFSKRKKEDTFQFSMDLPHPLKFRGDFDFYQGKEAVLPDLITKRLIKIEKDNRITIDPDLIPTISTVLSVGREIDKIAPETIKPKSV